MSIVCDAIRARLVLEFEYHGLPRIVAPYCHGLSTRGIEIMRAVQLRGSSRSGGFGFGKLWVVAELVGPRIVKSEGFVANDPQYNPNDHAMTKIHCRI